MTANGTTTAPADAYTPVQAPLPGARTALVLLLAINLFNYIDRQVLAAVLPKIRAALLADDPYAQTKLGLLTTAFIVAYMVFAPLFGWLGDRTSRWLLVGVGVILWSLASGASGLATSYLVLLLTRCFVGIGEGAYGPVAPTVISDLYPVARRGRVLAWFYVAIPVGGALGYVLGGVVAGTALGWSGAFYVVVPPGLLLGVLCFFMRDPPRGQADAAPARHRPPDGPAPAGRPPRGQADAAAPARQTGLKDYLALLRIPSYVYDTLGMTAMTFAVGGLAAWMPTYIYDREAHFRLTETSLGQLRVASSSVDAIPADVTNRLADLRGRTYYPVQRFRDELERRLSEDEITRHRERIEDAAAEPTLEHINLVFGVIVVVSGLVATLLGGWLGDALRGRYPGSYFLVSGASMLVAFPMVLLMLWTPFPLAWVFLFLAVFCLFFNTGPTNTILANVTHPSVRSTAFALNILIIHALGDAISPFVMGLIADLSSMDVALAVVSAIVLVGGLLWLWGARHLERDTALAPTRLTPDETPAS
jgi:MFS family permease